MAGETTSGQKEKMKWVGLADVGVTSGLAVSVGQDSKVICDESL